MLRINAASMRKSAAFIRERRLLEGGVYSNNYGSVVLRRTVGVGGVD